MNMTVLMIACFQGHMSVVELLLKVPGIDVNARDAEVYRSSCAATQVVHHTLLQEGVSALMWASHNGHTAVVQALLLDSRLVVNAHDKVCATVGVLRFSHLLLLQSGLTALLYAGSGGHTGTVQALVADSRVELNTQEKVCIRPTQFFAGLTQTHSGWLECSYFCQSWWTCSNGTSIAGSKWPS